MACGCLKNKTGEAGLQKALELGNTFVSLQKLPVQIYWKIVAGIEDKVYDFELINPNRENIIQIIEYNG